MYKRHKRLNQVNKTYSERIHAKKRAEERFGVTLNRFDYANIVAQITGQLAVFVERQSNRVSVFIVDLKGIPAIAIYDSERAAISTFLNEYGDPPKNPTQLLGELRQKGVRMPAKWMEK